MKTLILALTSVLAFQLQSALAASPEEEARFLAAARQGFEKQDTNAIFALTCWDRMSEKDIEYGKKKLVRYITTMKVSDMKLLNPDPNLPSYWKNPAGVEYRANLTYTKQLTITFAPGSSEKSGDFPVGEKDGKLYLSEAAPIK